MGRKGRGEGGEGGSRQRDDKDAKERSGSERKGEGEGPSRRHHWGRQRGGDEGAETGGEMTAGVLVESWVATGQSASSGVVRWRQREQRLQPTR